MEKTVIGAPQSGAGAATVPISKAVRASDFVFVSGQVPMGADGRLVAGGIEPQARQALDNVKAVLAEAGCGLADVVKCTVWLADPRDFATFNRVYGEYFSNDPPARSTVRADLMIDAKIEVEAIAFKSVDESGGR